MGRSFTSLSEEPTDSRNPQPIEISVVLPCLNESETVGRCVSKALATLRAGDLGGEVIVADNGSTDGSIEIAQSAGEQFYLVWPLIVWLVRPRAIPWVAGGLAAVSAVVRVIWLAHSGPQQAIAWATICRLDELFAGALCAYLFRSPSRMLRVRKWLPGMAILGIGSFLVILSGMFLFRTPMLPFLYLFPSSWHVLNDPGLFFIECGGFVLLALGFGAIVLLAAHTDGKKTWMQKFLTSRLLAPIGTYSYGIYVFHVPILGLASIFVFPKVARGVHSDGDLFITEGAYILMVAAVTFAISALSYEFFEKKILRMKRYFGAKYAAVPITTALEDKAATAETARA